MSLLMHGGKREPREAQTGQVWRSCSRVRRNGPQLDRALGGKPSPTQKPETPELESTAD